MTSETPNRDLVIDGPAAYAALVTGTETVTGPITGWNPYGPCIARLGEDGQFRGYVDSDAHTTAWVGPIPDLLTSTADLFVSVHGELATPPPPAPKTLPTDPDQIPLALAVERALTPTEQAAFLSSALTGPMRGATPADWIETAADEDAFLGDVEQWWAENGDDAIEVLLGFLPLNIAQALLLRAVYAWIPLKGAELPGQAHRMVTEIAQGAALWLRGYAEGRGWEVPQ